MEQGDDGGDGGLADHAIRIFQGLHQLGHEALELQALLGAHLTSVSSNTDRVRGGPHGGEPLHARFLGPRILAAHAGFTHQALDVLLARDPQLTQALHGQSSVSILPITQAVDHERQDAWTVGDDVVGILQVQSLEEMAQGRETLPDQQRVLRAGRYTHNLEQRGHDGVGDVMVLDRRLELVQLVGLGLHRHIRRTQVAQYTPGLAVHHHTHPREIWAENMDDTVGEVWEKTDRRVGCREEGKRGRERDEQILLEHVEDFDCCVHHGKQ